MAVPVINANTSVLAPFIGELWGYQPAASGVPLVWSEEIALYTFTADATTNALAITGADFAVGQRLRVSTSGTLPAPLSPAGYYYLLPDGLLALIPGGASIDITDTGTGTHSIGPSALPPGLALNPFTGLISGIPSQSGFYQVTLRAHNGDGPSDPFVFPIGVRPARALLDAAIGLQWDWPSNKVSAQQASNIEALTPDGEKTAIAPLISFKNKDQVMLAVQVTVGSLAFTPSIVALQVGIRREDEEPLLLRTAGAFIARGSGSETRYFVKLDFTSAPVGGIDPLSVVNDRAKLGNDAVLVWAEFRMAYQYETSPGVSEILYRASESFPVKLSRSLLAPV